MIESIKKECQQTHEYMWDSLWKEFYVLSPTRQLTALVIDLMNEIIQAR